jgi:integrase
MGMVGSAPHVRVLKEPTRRTGFLTHEDACKLLAELPPHMADMATFSLSRAGIDNFRWHDLRHTWASWHVQSGTPLFALQELGGWESAEMVRQYAHLAADHLTPFADRLGALTVPEDQIDGTFWAQPQNQAA